MTVPYRIHVLPPLVDEINMGLSGDNRTEVEKVADGVDMRHAALDIDLKKQRMRVGSSVMWAVVAIVLGCTGRSIMTVPPSVVGIWQWVQKYL